MVTNAAIPSTIISELLDDQWEVVNVAKPFILEVNAPLDAVLRFDLNRGDALFVRAEPATEQYRYHNAQKYFTKTAAVVVEIHTKQTRQILYNLMEEIRRICEVNTHLLDDFQFMKFTNFTEYTDEELNVWKGVVKIQMESSGVRSSYIQL